jgi:hypothetical protein
VTGSSNAPSRWGGQAPGIGTSSSLYDVGMRIAAYLAVAMALALFGYLALFSVGFPFLLTGLLMVALVAFRRRPDVIAPALLWPWVFTLGYVLVAPLGCTTSATPAVAKGLGVLGGATRCNGLLFTYAGIAPYSPPIWPALLFGAALATSITMLVRRAIRRRRTPAAAH